MRGVRASPEEATWPRVTLVSGQWALLTLRHLLELRMVFKVLLCSSSAMPTGSKGQITGQHGNWVEGSGMITGSPRAFNPLCFSILVWPGIGEGHLPNGWWHSLQEPPRMADHREFTSLEFGPRSVGSGGLLGQRIKRRARLSRAQIQNTSLTRLRYRNRILIH